jgi:hypothetical protein
VAAKGLVYLLVGVFAVQFARGDRGGAAGTRSVLASVADEPFGTFILIAVAVSLLGYTFWRVVQAVSDPQNDGAGKIGIARRAAKLVNGLVYGALALFAAALAAGRAATSGGEPATYTAKVLSMPLGEWWVFLIGLFIAGYGLYQVFVGYSEKFRRDLAESGMPPAYHKFVIQLGKTGFAARGVVFVVIGGLLLKAAAGSDPSEARGLDGALNALAGYEMILALVAAGLAAYGAYHLLAARHWRVEM